MRFFLLIFCFPLHRDTEPRGLMSRKKNKVMEQLNRIELRGNVGSVKLQNAGQRNGARFTLATNLAYHDKEGIPVIETSWHNVVAWEGRNIQDLDKIHKGDKIYVLGRLRYQKYTAPDGVEKFQTDVVASRITFIDDKEPLNAEM